MYHSYKYVQFTLVPSKVNHAKVFSPVNEAIALVLPHWVVPISSEVEVIQMKAVQWFDLITLSPLIDAPGQVDPWNKLIF